MSLPRGMTLDSQALLGRMVDLGGLYANMPTRPLFVTIETEDQYAKLRSKLAKRAAKKRERRRNPCRD